MQACPDNTGQDIVTCGSMARGHMRCQADLQRAAQQGEGRGSRGRRARGRRRSRGRATGRPRARPPRPAASGTPLAPCSLRCAPASPHPHAQALLCLRASRIRSRHAITKHISPNHRLLGFPLQALPQLTSLLTKMSSQRQELGQRMEWDPLDCDPTPSSSAQQLGASLFRGGIPGWKPSQFEAING